MISEWFSKRRLKRWLKGCDFEMAKRLLAKRFGGGVIPKDLAKLLDAFFSDPGVNTALYLIQYDIDFIALFELTQPGPRFTEHIFTDRSE